MEKKETCAPSTPLGACAPKKNQTKVVGQRLDMTYRCNGSTGEERGRRTGEHFRRRENGQQRNCWINEK